MTKDRQRIVSEPRHGERGSALLLALLVAVVLVFLGMGLLLQTSLGLQASGTDRWVVKGLYAADAGIAIQAVMLEHRDLAGGDEAGDNTFLLEDDPSLPGLLRGRYTITTDFCEVAEPSEDIGDEYGAELIRHFHVTSTAQRAVGGLVGLNRATVEADVTVRPFDPDAFVMLDRCYQ